MTEIICQPTIQDLGMQGEYLHIKVTFPIRSLSPHEGGGAFATHAGFYGVILKMRAEDLPKHPTVGETLHYDVGREMREHFGPQPIPEE